MIFYHAFTTYHLLEFIIHKQKFHRNEEAYLLYPEALYDKYPQMKQLETINIFTKVCQIYGAQNLAIKPVTNLRTFKAEIYPISSKDLIYVAGAQNAFAFWLIENEIPFVFFEEACGRLSRPEVIENNDMAIDINRYNLAKKYGMYTGENEYVTKVICNTKRQKEGWHNSKAVHFDVIKAMMELADVDKRKIQEFFNVPFIKNLKGTFLLTQHFANLKMMTYEEQMDLYKSTVDYYLPNDSLIIKTHPDDIAPYKEIFPDANIVTEKFPSELLLLMKKNIGKFSIATISSTGVNELSSYLRKCLVFDVEYEKEYKKNHIYYILSKIIDNVFNDNVRIGLFSNESQFKNMLNRNSSLRKIDYVSIDTMKKKDNRQKILIVDQSVDSYNHHQLLSEWDYVFFIDKNSQLLRDCMLDETYSSKIRFKYVDIFDKDLIGRREGIYMIIKDKMKESEIMKYEIERELKYSKLFVRTGKTELNDEAFAILEGQLSAAESQISLLQEEINTLQERLMKYEKHLL